MSEPRGPMFATSTPERRGRARLEARRARRRRAWTIAAAVTGGAVVLFVGIALGRALEEAPRSGGTQTQVRTLEPGTLPPVTRTVTVTSSGE